MPSGLVEPEKEAALSMFLVFEPSVIPIVLGFDGTLLYVHTRFLPSPCQWLE
jgi:hypothetical protein